MTKKIVKKTTKKKIDKKPHNRDFFDKAYYSFVSDFELLEKSLKVLGKVAEKYDKDAFKKLVNIEKKAKKKNATLTDADMRVLIEFVEMKPQQGSLFYKHTLVSAVGLLDEVFASLFRYYYSNNPSKLSLDNKSIPYKILNTVDKVEDAKAYLLDREIDSILMNGGVQNRIKLLKSELDIDTPGDENVTYELKKLIKIRNLITHNKCLADKKYVDSYGKGEIKTGETITITKDYVEKSLSLVFYFGGFALQSAQLKYVKDELRSNEYILNDVIHDLVKKDDFTYIEEIYKASKKMELDTLNKRMIVINYCLGLVKKGQNRKSIKKILEKEDWSIKNDETNLCLHALLGEDDKFYALLKKSIKDGTIRRTALLNWGIFALYNRKTEFKKIVKDIIK